MSDNENEHGGWGNVFWVLAGIIFIIVFCRLFYGGAKTVAKVLIWDAWLLASYYLAVTEGFEGPYSARNIAFGIFVLVVVMYTNLIWKGYASWAGGEERWNADEEARRRARLKRELDEKLMGHHGG